IALEKSDMNAVVYVNDGEDIHFSENFSSPKCGFTISVLEPRLFSFNSPFGACLTCDGLGKKWSVDESLVIPDDSLTLEEGAIKRWQQISSDYYPNLLKQVTEQFNIYNNTAFKD